MDERLRIDYESRSMRSATETVITLMDSGRLQEAHDFAMQAIENWRMEGKESIIANYIAWLATKGIKINVS